MSTTQALNVPEPHDLLAPAEAARRWHRQRRDELRQSEAEAHLWLSLRYADAERDLDRLLAEALADMAD